MSDRSFDVAVVGAGPVGLACALGFAGAGRRVALVGPAPLGRDGRTAALLDGSVALLAGLGLWPQVVPEAAPLRVMRLVDDTDSLFRPPPVAFRAAEIGLEAFGWNVENATLTASLAAAARNRPEITWLEGLASGFHASAEAGHVTLEDGATIRAALVVAADGRGSRIRKAAGIGATWKAYPQRAVTVILRHTRPHESTSTEFHTRAGPFTLVPLPGERSSLVWVTSPHHAVRLGEVDAATLARAVEAQSHRLLGDMVVDGARGSVPLGLQSVDRLTGPRLALVGEAAHVLPPIGAQGLNLGFADVAALLGAAAAGDPGTDGVLQRYARDRRGDIRLRAAAVNGLNTALLTSLMPVDALRGLGLGMLAQIGPLRRLVMRAGLTRAPLNARRAQGSPRPS
jgi:2-octaprenyl-6-methoxyphenol hydroxylase